MNCKECLSLIRQADQCKMSGPDSAAVRLHLSSCAHCASSLSASDWVEIWPPCDDGIEPSDDFSARFHARLSERQLAVHSKRWSWSPAFQAWGWPKQLLAAGSIAALLAAGIFLGRRDQYAPDRAGNFGDFVVAESLPLLQDMPVISNLDMLEDMDAIENLPPSPAAKE